MLLSKSEDTLDHIGKPNGTASLVIGHSHASLAPRLRDDKNYRGEVIKKFASYLLKIVDLSFKNWSNLSRPQIDQVKTNLLDAVAQVDLIKVTDPGSPDHVKDMSSFINRSVVFQETFQSPQLQKALESLYKP